VGKDGRRGFFFGSKEGEHSSQLLIKGPKTNCLMKIAIRTRSLAN
jgi:hypothetical protein